MQPIPIWITKFALSRGGGIEEATGFIHPINKEWVIVASGRCKGATFQNDDWHLTREKAAKWAEAQRQRLIELKRKDLADLESMTPFA